MNKENLQTEKYKIPVGVVGHKLPFYVLFLLVVLYGKYRFVCYSKSNSIYIYIYVYPPPTKKKTTKNKTNNQLHEDNKFISIQLKRIDINPCIKKLTGLLQIK